MIFGIGIDIVEHQRIARLWNDHHTRFSEDILTEEEQQVFTSLFADCSEKQPVNPKLIFFLATKFSAKEAVIKSLQWPGVQPFAWTDIGITERQNHWSVHLKNNVYQRAAHLKIKKIYGTSARSNLVTQSIAIGEIS